jgi:hypothetical protein
MSRIKRSLAAGIAALALFGLPAAGAGAGVSTQPDHGARAVVAKSCAGYTRAIIGSQIKCLRRCRRRLNTHPRAPVEFSPPWGRGAWCPGGG